MTFILGARGIGYLTQKSLGSPSSLRVVHASCGHLQSEQKDTTSEDIIYATTPHQEQIASLWSILLHQSGADKVPINKSFFELGGSSLVVVKMLAQLYKSLPVKVYLFLYVVTNFELNNAFQISLEEFYASPTIEFLADKVPNIWYIEEKTKG